MATVKTKTISKSIKSAATGKAALGNKRLCQGCGTLYYDLNKTPPTCPKCSTEYSPETILKASRRMSPDEEAALKKKAEAKVAETEEEILEEAEDEENYIEDPEELGDDDAEISADIDTSAVNKDE